MLRKISLIVCSLHLSGCVSLPDKPDLEGCTYDHPRGQGVCVEKPANGPAKEPVRVPVADLDKALCFRGESREKLLNYLNDVDTFREKAEELVVNNKEVDPRSPK